MGAVARALWVDFCRIPGQRSLFLEAQRHCDIKRVTAPEAIDPVIAECRPQFLCIEFDYPDQRRLHVVPQMTRRYPALPVLMVTDFHSEALAVWAFRSRVFDYRVKPIDRQTLTRLLDAMARASVEAGRCDPDANRLPFGLIAPAGHLRRPFLTARRTGVAVAYISEHFANPIHLEDVARACHLSTWEFSRMFHREQGMPFRRFLLKYRINRARDLLVDQTVSVSEVAFAVGFSDLSYFGRTFRQLVGVSATQYQRSSAAPCRTNVRESGVTTLGASLSDSSASAS